MRSLSRLHQTQGRKVMIVMLDTPDNLEECEKEIGVEVEELFTPLTRRNPKRPQSRFAIDNGAFSHFDHDGFLKTLEKHESRKKLCRFVAAPDVVGSARRTLECFQVWRLKLGSWPVAFVCQDGQENERIPWFEIEAIFIGGSTEWKMSRHAAAIVKASKIMGKWCHIGRINTPGRYEYFKDLGADSCDGTGLAQYSHMREAIKNSMENPRLL